MTRRPRFKRASLAAAVALVLLAGCGSDTMRPDENSEIAGQAVRELLTKLRRKPAAATPAAPASPEVMALEVLRLNPGPLLFVTRDGAPTPVVVGLTETNGATRTYATPDFRTFSLRQGIIVATRGLGDDMMSSETEAVSRLILTRSAGEAEKKLRVLDGLGTERPLPLSCKVSLAKGRESYEFAGQTWSGALVAEHCTGNGFEMTNSYLVADTGEIHASRQWISPRIGYVTVQTLRH